MVFLWGCLLDPVVSAIEDDGVGRSLADSEWFRRSSRGEMGLAKRSSTVNLVEICFKMAFLCATISPMY